MDVETLVEAWRKGRKLPAPFFAGLEVELCFEDEEHLYEFAPAILRFFSLTTLDRDAASHHAYAYFRDIVDEVGFEDGWIEEGMEKLSEPGPAIWGFVYPKSISACLSDEIGDRTKKRVYVELEANCGWEAEHGLQMSWRDGADLVKLSSYDGHATNAHAYDDDRKDAYVYYTSTRGLSTANTHYKH